MTQWPTKDFPMRPRFWTAMWSTADGSVATNWNVSSKMGAWFCWWARVELFWLRRPRSTLGETTLPDFGLSSLARMMRTFRQFGHMKGGEIFCWTARAISPSAMRRVTPFTLNSPRWVSKFSITVSNSMCSKSTTPRNAGFRASSLAATLEMRSLEKHPFSWSHWGTGRRKLPFFLALIFRNPGRIDLEDSSVLSVGRLWNALVVMDGPLCLTFRPGLTDLSLSDAFSGSVVVCLKLASSAKGTFEHPRRQLPSGPSS
mmetsp:Transcript_4988/g.11999  ORF Transcript_4988/g.11999 Transcript_4988/m.11999 type:complete len:258 (+) Transcript_4988:3078-3851(+)